MSGYAVADGLIDVELPRSVRWLVYPTLLRRRWGAYRRLLRREPVRRWEPVAWVTGVALPAYFWWVSPHWTSPLADVAGLMCWYLAFQQGFIRGRQRERERERRRERELMRAVAGMMAQITAELERYRKKSLN